jgi:hypothetical protein
MNELAEESAVGVDFGFGNGNAVDVTTDLRILFDLKLYAGANPLAGQFGGWTGESGEEWGLAEHFVASDQEKASEGGVKG